MAEARRRDLFVTGEYVQHFRPEDRSNPFRAIYQRKLEDALAILGPVEGRRILDAGGGMGRLSIPLARAGARVTLLDLSAAMIQEARRRAAGGPAPLALVADASRLPFRGGSFDAVVALDLFCHLPDPQQGLAELHRVLVPGGRLLMDSTNSNPLWVLFYPRYVGRSPRKWVSVLSRQGVLPGWVGRVHHYREREFRGALERGGFAVERIQRYGPAPCPKWHMALARANR